MTSLTDSREQREKGRRELLPAISATVICVVLSAPFSGGAYRYYPEGFTGIVLLQKCDDCGIVRSHLW